jgi:hypothetical protein
MSDDLFDADTDDVRSGPRPLRAVIVVLAVVAVAIAAVVTYRSLRRDFLNEAHAAMAHGEYARALSFYAQGALAHAPAMRLPDKNRAKILDESAWREEVGAYLHWMLSPPDKNASTTAACLQGVASCTAHVENEHFVTADPDFPARAYGYEKHWYDAFFPALVTERGDHAALIERAMQNDVSICHIASFKGFTYEGALIRVDDGKAVTFTLYPESELYLLTPPGRYVILCAGEVTFPNGQVWESDYSAIFLHAPDSATVRPLALKTQVRRERQ